MKRLLILLGFITCIMSCTENSPREITTDNTVTEITEPTATEPEVIEPEVVEPEVVEPEVVEPEVVETKPDCDSTSDNSSKLVETFKGYFGGNDGITANDTIDLDSSNVTIIIKNSNISLNKNNGKKRIHDDFVVVGKTTDGKNFLYQRRYSQGVLDPYWFGNSEYSCIETDYETAKILGIKFE